MLGRPKSAYVIVHILNVVKFFFHIFLQKVIGENM